MPRTYRQPAPNPRIPHTSHAAHALLAGRDYVRLDRTTMMVGHAGMISVSHTLTGRGTIPNLIRYYNDGRITVRSLDPYDLSEFRRVVPVLPHEWTGEWRTARMRPRIVYRGVYTISWPEQFTFHPLGDIEFGRGNRLTIDDLNAEADVREGVTPMASRRRTPRPIPAWAQRTYAVPTPAPSPLSPGNVQYSRILESLRTWEQAPSETAAPTPTPAPMTWAYDAPEPPDRGFQHVHVECTIAQCPATSGGRHCTICNGRMPDVAPDVAEPVHEDGDRVCADYHVQCICGECHTCQTEARTGAPVDVPDDLFTATLPTAAETYRRNMWAEYAATPTSIRDTLNLEA